MKGWITGAAAFALLAGGPALARGPAPKAEPACGEYGTSVHFEDTPVEAAKAAKKDNKLVMVLHVSGHFEDPGLT